MQRTITSLVFAIILLASTGAVAGLLVTMDAKVEGTPGKPVIAGTTNLPNGTQLLVSLERGTNYVAQAKATVSNGRFTAGPFSQGSSALSSGQYMLNITVPLVEQQPADVARLFGPKGRNLEGPLVRQSSVGLGNVVELERKIQVAATANQNKEAASRVSQASKYVDTVQAELRKGASLLKRNPSTAEIGAHSKRMSGLIQEGQALQGSSHQCAGLGSFAWSFWWYGMVGSYNNGAAAANDYRNFRSDYEEQLGKCRSALKG